MELLIKVHNLKDAESLGIHLGENIRGGECIEFVGDVGSGKTTIIKSIVAGAGSEDIVTSPSFTIGKQYDADELTVYHYDFYRLSEPGLMKEELREASQDSNAVLLIEWGQTVQDVLPKNRIIIQIDKVGNNAEGRSITITAPDELKHILKGIKT